MSTHSSPSSDLSSTSVFPTRTSSSSPTNDQIDQRRKRKEATLSCAECRRLKLRCDRQFPCTTCVRRGCAAICPDGHLATGQGNRFVLASTEYLHDHIQKLSLRVRSLEDGLRQSYEKEATGTEHPLLSSDLLDIKAPLQRSPKPKLALPKDANLDSLSASLSATDFGFALDAAGSSYLGDDSRNVDPRYSAQHSQTWTVWPESGIYPHQSSMAPRSHNVESLFHPANVYGDFTAYPAHNGTTNYVSAAWPGDASMGMMSSYPEPLVALAAPSVPRHPSSTVPSSSTYRTMDHNSYAHQDPSTWNWQFQ